jgi:hypothetical protein
MLRLGRRRPAEAAGPEGAGIDEDVSESGIGLAGMLEHQQAGVSCDDDLHLLRQGETRTPFPAATANQVLHLLQQPVTLPGSQPAREGNSRPEDVLPRSGNGWMERGPRPSAEEGTQQRRPSDGERAGEHPARDQSDEEPDEHAAVLPTPFGPVARPDTRNITPDGLPENEESR